METRQKTQPGWPMLLLAAVVFAAAIGLGDSAIGELAAETGAAQVQLMSVDPANPAVCLE